MEKSAEQDLPIHTVEQVALYVMKRSVSRPHYDDGLLAEFDDERAAEFQTYHEARFISERIDILKSACSTKLSLLMDPEDINVYLNDLDEARDLSIDEYELCRTLRFLSEVNMTLIRWV